MLSLSWICTIEWAQVSVTDLDVALLDSQLDVSLIQGCVTKTKTTTEKKIEEGL